PGQIGPRRAVDERRGGGRLGVPDDLPQAEGGAAGERVGELRRRTQPAHPGRPQQAHRRPPQGRGGGEVGGRGPGRGRAGPGRGGGAGAEEVRAGDARRSPVLRELCWAEASRQMDVCLAKLDAALAGDTERLVFRGKLEGLTERELAERVEAELGGRMTVFMV